MGNYVNDSDHAVLDAQWHQAFGALRAAGLGADADHPIAATYRAASDAINHANRSRDYAIVTGAGLFNQAQDSLSDQLRRVIVLANEAGEYDAADWLARALDVYEFGPQRTVSEQHTQRRADG